MYAYYFPEIVISVLMNWLYLYIATQNTFIVSCMNNWIVHMTKYTGNSRKEYSENANI